MNKLLLTITAMLLPMLASAQDAVEIDGIYYNLVNKAKQAEVTKNPNYYSGDIAIPESVPYNGEVYSVTSIGHSAFNKCIGLTSVTIPDGVTSIGAYAFQSCSGLTSITIPDGVTSIYISTFRDCSSLTSVTIPKSVTSIGQSAFYGCSKLNSITIPDGVTSISDNAFENCSGLTSVTIGNGVTSIGEKVFRDCSGLTSVTMGNSVTSIGSYAFQSCSGLTSITIPDGVTSIGEKAFQDCSGLYSITIPNSVTSIGEVAFANCSGLTAVTIGNGVTKIGYATFSSCSGLTSVTIGNGVTSIGWSAFSDCSGLTTITIPNSVTTIGMHAFSGCSGLTTITIPNNVTSIDGGAFYKCSGLTSITIGSGIKTVGSSTFADCSELLDVYCHAEIVPETNSDAFQGSYIEYCTLHVPAASVSAYQAEVPWSDFKNIVKIDMPEHTLTYKVDGEVYKTYNIEEDETITPEPYPTKEGYTFSGWDEIPETMPDHDVIVNGYFELEINTDNVLLCENLECISGSAPILEVVLENKDEVKLCQFDLLLPTGVSVATKSNGKLDVNLTERAESHSVSSKQLENGNYRIVVASLDNDSFTGNGGTLLEITLNVPSTMVSGEYAVKITNTELSVPNGNDLKVVKTADTESKLIIKSYTPGDVNNDGSVSVTDVGCTINYILEQIPSVFIIEAADMNGDKVISVTDVGMIINVILNDGVASRQKQQRNVTNANLSLIPASYGYQLLLEDKDAFIGFQMDIQLMNGTTISDMRLNDDNGHLLTYRQLDNGKYRVICYSLTNSVFGSNDAALLNITTDSDIAISNIRLTTVGLSEVGFNDINATPTGIANASGLIHQTSELKIYSLDGRLCRIIRVQPGENPLNGLKAGIYLIGNRKVIVK